MVIVCGPERLLESFLVRERACRVPGQTLIRHATIFTRSRRGFPMVLLWPMPQVYGCLLGHRKSVEESAAIISLAGEQRSVAGLPIGDNDGACHVLLITVEFTEGTGPDELG